MKTPFRPYVAEYLNGKHVLVLSHNKDGVTASGYMIEGNAVYAPMEYYGDCWSLGYLTPTTKKVSILPSTLSIEKFQMFS